MNILLFSRGFLTVIKFSFSVVLRLVIFPVTLGLMLMGDPMFESMTGLLMLATLDSVTVGRPVMVVIALMLIWKEGNYIMFMFNLYGILNIKIRLTYQVGSV